MEVQLAAKGGSLLKYLMAMVYANRDGIPPNPAHTALPLWPDDILITSRGNPDTKEKMEPEIGPNRSKSAMQPSCIHRAKSGHKPRFLYPTDKIFLNFTSQPGRIRHMRHMRPILRLKIKIHSYDAKRPIGQKKENISAFAESESNSPLAAS